jgi:hypothetical protein
MARRISRTLVYHARLPKIKAKIKKMRKKSKSKDLPLSRQYLL